MIPARRDPTAPDPDSIAVADVPLPLLRDRRLRFRRRGDRRDRDQHGLHLGIRQRRVNGVHYRTDGDVAPAVRHEKDLQREGQLLHEGPGAVPGRDGRDRPARARATTTPWRSSIGTTFRGSSRRKFPERRTSSRSSARASSWTTRRSLPCCSETTSWRSADSWTTPAGSGRSASSPSLPRSGSSRSRDSSPVCPFPTRLSGSARCRTAPARRVTVSYGPAIVSGLPEGPVNGMYVQVTTTDREPVGGVITATRIVKLAARTEFPDGTPVDLEGLVTTPWSGSGNDLSFAVEGKAGAVGCRHGIWRWHQGRYSGKPIRRCRSRDGNRRSSIRCPNRFPIGKSDHQADGNDGGGEHEFIRNGCRRCPGVRFHALVVDIAWVGSGRVGDVVPEEDLSPARRGRRRSAPPSHPPRISPPGRSSRQRPRRRPGRHPLPRPRHPSTTSG